MGKGETKYAFTDLGDAINGHVVQALRKAQSRVSCHLNSVPFNAFISDYLCRASHPTRITLTNIQIEINTALMDFEHRIKGGLSLLEKSINNTVQLSTFNH